MTLAELYSLPPAEVDRWPAQVRGDRAICRCPLCGGWMLRARGCPLTSYNNHGNEMR